MTDGIETRGSVEDAVARLASDVDLLWVPLERAEAPEVLIDEVSAPSRVVEGEPHRVRIVVRSSIATGAILRVYRGSKPVAASRVQLQPGQANLFSFEQTAPRATDAVVYRAEIEADDDGLVENNRGAAVVRVEGRSRVLIVDRDPRSLEPLARALESGEMEVELGGAGLIPGNLLGLTAYDAVVFADMPATQLSDGQMRALRDYVETAGGGFVMLGGPDSLGPGGYWRTPVEEILPVSMELKDRTHYPSLGLVMCIDKSGSMAGHARAAKIEVAKASAAEVAAQLTPMDQVGVIAFDAAAKWVVPLVSGGDRDRVVRSLGTVRAGGGTDAYPAMEEARRALRGAPVRIKHVILLTDGQLQGRDHVGLAEVMRTEGITISTVGVGTDADLFTLQRIAMAGGGRFYPARDIVRLPRIFLREVFHVSRPWLVEESFRPVRSEGAMLPELRLDAAPPLAGYVATSDKSRAQHLLLTHRDEPLLSVWRFGLGKTVAFTSDAKGRWSDAWLRWDGYAPFWAGVVRWAARGHETAGRLRAGVSVSEGRLRVAADYVDSEGSFVNGATPKTVVVGPDGFRAEVPLAQVGPGRYEAEVRGAPPGPYLAAVLDSTFEGNTVGATTTTIVPYSDEFRSLDLAPEALERLVTSGRVRIETDHDGFFSHRGTGGIVRWSLVPLLLGAASILFVGEIAARKLRFDRARRRSDATRAASRMSERFARLRSARGRALKEKERDEVAEPVTAADALPADPREVRAGSRPRPEETKPTAEEGPPEDETHTSRLLRAKRKRPKR
jgi:uncharacterized membrane protein